MSDHEYLQAALTEARAGYAEGGIPIGCVLVKNDTIVGAGHNRRVQNDSATRHAEIDALETTGRHPGSWYADVTLYTTLSPCAMCSGAILLYGIPRVVIGDNTSFLGEETWLAERGIELTVLDNTDCRQLMAGFMRESPALWNEDIGK